MVNPQKEWNRSDNLNKLLSLLKQFGELQFHELKQKLEVSEPTLTEYLKKLENENKIEAVFKPNDRQKKWYRIKAESKEIVEGQLGQSEVIKFINEIPDLVYVYKEPLKDEDIAIAAFGSAKDREMARKLLGKAIRSLQETYRQKWVKAAFRLLKLENFALVIMKGGEKAK